MTWYYWGLIVFAFITLLTAGGMVVAYWFMSIFLDVLAEALMGKHE